MKTVEQNYKGHKIEARLTNDHEQTWVVLIDDVHYQNLAADNDESAMENAQIKIDTDEYFKKNPQY